ncbi:endonuclease/exonuclease/phosphatase family protein [Tranquillimonas alkanivorans]|uniref:Endonuclease/Exonuclease/phosphatase family protein n=1 Tax=Tranquillimonas alkanivorans TaxID=441119 RepID=A0A1I5N687_9RHOB|nr:endonuclease/exonuclease/phosphatase family protein [Tranquillimonas alkanivorans]SFP17244.1 Endonuclease/Exonuclease/phosphatase family protein [Tranquillimonas alkanivorans]
MRIATWNVEWFSALFADDGRVLDDAEPSWREGVNRADQLAAIAIVLTAMDADAVMVIEAPDTSPHRSGVRALESFARYFDLRTRRAVIGFANDTKQEIILLQDPDKLMAEHDPRGDPVQRAGAFPRFDSRFKVDLGNGAGSERVTWSKPPLELAVTTAQGTRLRMIGVHAKSKAPSGARSEAEIRRRARAARRKHVAQCLWLRGRADEHLAAGDPLILLGDLNDGPGLDAHERDLGRSGLEIVLDGDGGAPLHDPHARAAIARPDRAPTTARFFLPEEDRCLTALLDYVMVSPDLAARQGRWRIWHPLDDPGCRDTPELREALLTASDHFPVTLDIDI